MQVAAIALAPYFFVGRSFSFFLMENNFKSATLHQGDTVIELEKNKAH